MDSLKDRYFADGSEPESERSRLTELAGFYAGWTQDWLSRRVAFRPGMAVMEAGAGSGAMLAWFAQQTGPSGDVLGLDRTLAHMDALPAPVRLMEADLYDAPAEPGRFDLVYARLVLEHLPDPDTALARLCEWVRPGGVLAVASLDFADVKAVGEGPDARRFDMGLDTIREAIATSALVDPAFGRTLKGRFGAAGLSALTEDRLERVVDGASDWARFLASNNRIIGALTGVDTGIVDEVCALMERPGFRFADQMLFGVTGRRS
ncbi:MAG: class I SAM-dependent methyltransferase [Glycocaulis sp.]